LDRGRCLVDDEGMKALVTVMPLAGHVDPITGLVAELIGRGHSVTVYTGSNYCERFAELGATPVRWSAATDFDEEDVAATFPAAGRPGRRGMVAMTKAVFFDTAPGQVHDLGRELDRSPADVIIGDIMSMGAGCISELRRLPWATVNVLPFNSLGKDLAPLAFGLAPARGRLGRMRDVILWQAFGAATLPFKRAYNQARIQVGLATDPRMYGVGLVSPWLVLATGCPSLERPGAELPNQIHYVGRLSPSGGKSGSTIPPSADPHVVVTQGTHHVELTDLIQPAIEGLCELDVSVVATTGRRGHTDIGVEVPQNAQIVDFLDFRSVLPAASVFVTNGGWGGVLASLAAGVPLVIAGGDIDKPAIAAWVARAGAGINLRTGRPKPEAVAAAVREMLADPAYAERARQIGAELVTLGGAQKSVELLEDLAETAEPVRR
jgi:UDP:flavonoid glycosyltransferase YjiC (YdhE family)